MYIKKLHASQTATIVIAIVFTVSLIGQVFVQSASALSAATFTAKPTFTSLNSGKWARVWTDSATPTTYFLDVSTTQIKSVRINNADGSINSTVTYALPGSANAAISAVETVGGVNRVYYVQIKNQTAIYTGIVNINSGAAISTATLTVTNLANGANGYVGIATTPNAVYYEVTDGGSSKGALYGYYSTRALGTMTAIGGVLNTGAATNTNLICNVATDGAATAQDKVYCLQSADTNGARIIELTSASNSVLTSVGAVVTSSNPTLIDVSGVMVVTITVSGTINTYTITKSTDTLSSLQYGINWLSLQNQQFDFNGSTRTYKSGSIAYYAMTNKAVSWTATTGTLNDPAQLYVENVTSGTGTITGISSTFYRISDSLVVYGSATTWTPKVITASSVITPTLYKETLLGALTVDNPILANGNYIRLICDANYQFPAVSSLYAGSSTDCVNWITLASPSASVGRSLPFATSKDLVRAATVTGYTFSLSVADPTVYNIATIYGGKTVDSVHFDSSGQAQQRLLYGQCYTMSVTEISTGNSVQSGNVCAGDDTSKVISLTGVNIPADWLGHTWSHSVTRNFTSPTNNTVLFAVQKSVSPYNASIYVTDNADTSHATINQWFNFTNASGISVANVTSGVSVNSNQTLWFTVYENGVVVLHDISSGQGFNFGGVFDNLGTLYGLPVAMIFPILVAVVFPKSYAYFGIIVVGAVIGIMQFFGFNFGPFAWPAAFALIGIGVMMGVKRSG